MKTKTIIILIFIMMKQISFAQPLDDTVKDIEGNEYGTIQIGEQIWTVDFLKTTKFNDGSDIPNIKDNNEWSKLESSAYCDFYNSKINYDKFGKLYNWFAVKDNRKLCPVGWHIPDIYEWETVIKFISRNKELNKYKGWWSYETHGEAYLPIDSRTKAGKFLNDNELIKINYGGWWSGTNNSPKFASFAKVGFSSFNLMTQMIEKTTGLCVLCIKDKK